MENYSLLMGAAAVMKMAVEMAAVSMEKPSGALPRSGVPNRDSVPRSWLRDGGGSGTFLSTRPPATDSEPTGWGGDHRAASSLHRLHATRTTKETVSSTGQRPPPPGTVPRSPCRGRRLRCPGPHREGRRLTTSWPTAAPAGADRSKGAYRTTAQEAPASPARSSSPYRRARSREPESPPPPSPASRPSTGGVSGDDEEIWASGLRTNFAKCSVSSIGCSEDEAAGAARLMECQLAQFPVKYLGIPLSIRRLSAASFQPLVDRAEANGGHCHVNWSRVCRPLRLEGLGIPDLARTATSLRVRWIWRMRTDPMRPWRGLDMQFSKMELDVFTASIMMEVGDGEAALFWKDKWLDGRSIKEMAPKVYALVPKRRRKAHTVREALIELARQVHSHSGSERLARWGLPHAPRCALCDQAVETMAHLLTGCSFSRTVWFEVLSWIRSTSGPPTVEGDFAEWWSLAVRRPSPAAQRNFVDYHAYGVVNMETPECDGIRQRTAFGDVPVQRH
ncbi:hypothetical protein QYE76_032842 [Lolium multiflorum]|uniref:Reverse transcriptase zinc-binding domain-containing protein n=1 Tax=Lolium multiflorum TaxID=4521 RepID=A0AAD8VJR9_LOLMU|nr:hypothetical protein QYE76_032842 [Lolium multiflorum]